jgi:CBS domain-containing protein
MLVREVLKIKGDRIVSIAPEASLADAVSLMVQHDIGSLIVMRKGEMVGMLTFREVLQALNGANGPLAGQQVDGAMVKNPAFANPDDTVDQMRTVMTEQHIRYLPIREGGEFLGVLSFHDVAKAALKAASFENRLLKTYIKNWPEPEAKV